MRRILVALLVGAAISVGTAIALAGGTGHGGSCKKDSDCQTGLVCKMDPDKGHKTCQSK